MTNRTYHYAQGVPEGAKVRVKYGRLTYTHIHDGYFTHPETGVKVDLWGKMVYVVGHTMDINELEWV